MSDSLLLSLLPVVVFLLGTIVGSFLNVVLLRFRQRSFVTGRSSCPHCGRLLGAGELIPVLSYLFQWGRCRACKTPLSLQYPVIELTTGLLFLLVHWHVGLPQTGWQGLLYLGWLAIMGLLLLITVYDYWYTIIPNPFVYTLIVLAGLLLFVTPGGLALPGWEAAIAGPLLWLPFYLLWRFSGGTWIGLGDAKLAWAIGWLLGLGSGLSAIVFSFWIGAIVSLSLLGLQRLGTSGLWQHRGQLTMKSEVPFGPFMIAGLLLVWIFGLSVYDVVWFLV